MCHASRSNGHTRGAKVCLSVCECHEPSHVIRSYYYYIGSLYSSFSVVPIDTKFFFPNLRLHKLSSYCGVVASSRSLNSISIKGSRALQVHKANLQDIIIMSSQSSKRKADVQITKDDYNPDDNNSTDNNDDNDRYGTVMEGYGIPKASAEQLRQRRMVRAKRPAAATNNTNNKNVFGNIQLVSTKTTTTSSSSEGLGTTAAATNKDKQENSAKPPVFGANKYTGFAITASAQSKEKGTTTTTTSKPATSFVFGAASSSTFSGFGSVRQTTTTTTTTNTPFGGFGSSSAGMKTKLARDDSDTAGDDRGTGADRKGAVDTASGDAHTTTNHHHHHQGTANSNTFPSDFVPQSGEENLTVLLEQRCRVYRWGQASLTTGATNAEDTTVPSVPPSHQGFDVASAGPAALLPLPKPADNQTTTTTTAAAAQEDDTTTTNDTYDWIEVGLGPVRVLQKQPDRQHYGWVTQRRQPNLQDTPTTVTINCNLGAESTVTAVSDRHVKFSTYLGTHRLLLFRCKDKAAATDLSRCLRAVIAESKSFFDQAEESSSSSSLANKDGSSTATSLPKEEEEEAPAPTDTTGSPNKTAKAEETAAADQ